MAKVLLKHILKPKMDVLFVPLNPPDISNSQGHYFSRVRTFWNILYDAGLITQRIEDILKADEMVFNSNRINYRNLEYGIADLVRTVESNSNNVKPSRDDLLSMLSIIEKYKPKVVCIMHSKVRNIFIRFKIIPKESGYGFVGKHYSSILFIVPFPTGSNLSKKKITKHYEELRMLLDRIKN